MQDGQAQEVVGEAPRGRQAPPRGEAVAVAGAARVVGAMTLLSRVAGLARDAAIGAVLGATPAADAFFAAFRIPNLVRRVVAEGAASAALVPVFTRAMAAGGQRGAMAAAAATGGAAFAVLALLTAAGMAAAPQLAAVFAPGFDRDPALAGLAASLVRWTFPYLLLVGMAAWAMGLHHTLRNFVLPAAGPVVMNVAILAATLAVAPGAASPAHAVAGGVVAGGVLQVLIQLPALARAGLSPRMFTRLGHPAVKEAGGLVAAAAVGGSVYQVNVLVATVFGSLLPAGTVSWLWYADRVLEFPLGVVATAVGTAALPSLAAHAAARRHREMAATLEHAVGLAVAFCLPAAVGLALLAGDVAALLFERGSFGPADSAATASTIRAGALGLVGVGISQVLTPAFFALGRPRVPVAVGIATMALNALLAMAWMGEPGGGSAMAAVVSAVRPWLGMAEGRHAGLAAATAVSALANAAVLLAMLRTEIQGLGYGFLVRCLAVHALAAGLMAGALAWALPAMHAWVFPGAGLASVAAGVLGGGALYLAAALALGSSEVRQMAGLEGRGRS